MNGISKKFCVLVLFFNAIQDTTDYVLASMLLAGFVIYLLIQGRLDKNGK